MTHQKHKLSKHNNDADTVTIGVASFDAMWAEVSAKIKTPRYEDMASEGWRDTKEISRALGLGLSQTDKRMHALVDRGEMDVAQAIRHKTRVNMFRPKKRAQK
jgi:hypothetical protein